LDGFAKNDSPRRRWTIRSFGDQGWLYTSDDDNNWDDSHPDFPLTEFRQGPRRSQDDDGYEDEEDDWDDAGDLDEYDDDDYEWDDDEDEDSDEW
jgi:hypothetical protein